jgi:hypothetical protein
MIKQETVEIRGKQYRKTYSDAGKMIEQVGTGRLYSEAVDWPNSPHEYVETDIPIEVQNDSEL